MEYDDAAERRHLALREEFLLDPSVTFLNHGSFGACPRPVFETYQAWQRELERQPVEFLGRRLQHLLGDARASLAAYVHAQPDDLVYVPNVTTALNIVARSLPLQPGDEILTSDHEYGALQRTWTFVAERRQAVLNVRTLPMPLNDRDAVVEAIWAGVTPHTRVLFLSHITSPTAVILPIEPLVARARAAGIWTVIDGAHAPGQIDLDLAALGADFYAGNLHKWANAPKGAGFLYARPEVQDLLEPLVISWGWRPVDAWSTPFVDALQRQGTHDPAAYLSVPAAIAFQRDRDWPRVREECHALVRLSQDAMADLTGLPPLSPWVGQMAAFPLPEDLDPQELKTRLYAEQRIEIPVTPWGQRPWLRISVQGYNTRADVDRLLTAMAHLLPLTVR